MENCIENIVNMDGNTSFGFDDMEAERKLPEPAAGGMAYDMCSLEEWEKKAILACIGKCDGNITRAAQILGVNRSTLHAKMNKYQEEEGVLKQFALPRCAC